MSNSFIEVPELSELTNLLKRKTKDAPLAVIFLSQSIDHAITFIIFIFILFSGLSVLEISSFPVFFVRASSSFWLGLWGLAFVCALGYRLGMRLIFGKSIGVYFLGIESQNSNMLLQALSFALPSLWLLDLTSRAAGWNPLGSSYIFSYGQRP